MTDAWLRRAACMCSILIHSLGLGLDVDAAAVDALMCSNDFEGAVLGNSAGVEGDYHAAAARVGRNAITPGRRIEAVDAAAVHDDAGIAVRIKRQPSVVDQEEPRPDPGSVRPCRGGHRTSTPVTSRGGSCAPDARVRRRHVETR